MDLIEELVKKLTEANAYNEEIRPMLDKGFFVVQQQVIISKLAESLQLFDDLEVEVEENHAVRLKKIELENRMAEEKKEIQPLVEDALEKAARKDWLKFISQCKLNTRRYDEIDTKMSLVYRQVQNKELEKDDMRTIQTYVARSILDFFTDKQKLRLCERLREKEEKSNPADDVLVESFINRLGISLEAVMEGTDLYAKVDSRYHPFVTWIVQNVNVQDSLVDSTLEQLSEIQQLTLTNQRIEKYVEQFIRRFKLLDAYKDRPRKERNDAIEGYKKTLTELFKTVYADNYIGF